MASPAIPRLTAGAPIRGATRTIHVTVNDVPFDIAVQDRTLLVHFLRDILGMTGTHIGCDTTHCGACTVLLDNRPVKSCTVLAVQADGCKVRTVEGLEVGGKLSAVQDGFTSGARAPVRVLHAGNDDDTSTALLAKNPNPSEEEIRRAISGNLCRCTGS